MKLRPLIGSSSWDRIQLSRSQGCQERHRDFPSSTGQTWVPNFLKTHTARPHCVLPSASPHYLHSGETYRMPEVSMWSLRIKTETGTAALRPVAQEKGPQRNRRPTTSIMHEGKKVGRINT
jgi:hypothetical protein